ncbi:hypothetical protein [Nocardiopsis dassonvillei]|uniref:hypothetical protein n=1 Tax=Nocardiopsis dassonvillei TaxID=2014 RepID=UPI00366DD60D
MRRLLWAACWRPGVWWVPFVMSRARLALADVDGSARPDVGGGGSRAAAQQARERIHQA